MKTRDEIIEHCLLGKELFSDQSSKDLYEQGVRMAFEAGEKFNQDNQ